MSVAQAAPEATLAGRAQAGPNGSPQGLPSAELRLLNGFDLRLDGQSVPVPLSAQRVLAFLALSDRPVVRAALAGKLWLDGTEPHALGSLRSALWRLRRPGFALVDDRNGTLGLIPGVPVDARRVLSWARRQLDGVVADEDEDLEQLRLSGELLPDWYDDWVVLERERLREVRARALEVLCARLTSAASYHRATEAALTAIGDDPLRESAHRCLIRVHMAEGNEAEAIHCYRRFRKLLLEELGLEPSRHMEALIGAVMER